MSALAKVYLLSSVFYFIVNLLQTDTPEMNLYRRQQVYQLDQLAMQKDALPSVELMQRAARGVWNQIQQRWPDLRRHVRSDHIAQPDNDFVLSHIAYNAGVLVRLGHQRR